MKHRSRSRRARSASRIRLIDNRHNRDQLSPSSSEDGTSDWDNVRVDSRQRTRYRRRDSPDADLAGRFRTLRLVPQQRDLYFEHNIHGRHSRGYDEHAFEGDRGREAAYMG